MRKSILLITFVIISCANNQGLTNEDLIGVWESEFIRLQISENVIYRTENNKKIEYDNYVVEKDTLKMYRNNTVEKHLIKIKDKNKLVFSPIDAYQKDIELLDQTTFTKVE